MEAKQQYSPSEKQANATLQLCLLIVLSEIWFFCGGFSSIETTGIFCLICCAFIFISNKLISYYKEKSYRYFYQQQGARMAQWKEYANTFYDTQYPHLDFGDNKTFNYFAKGAKIQTTSDYSCRATLYCEATPINDTISLSYKWVAVGSQKPLGTEQKLDLCQTKLRSGDVIECHATAKAPCGTTTTTIDTVVLSTIRKTRREPRKTNPTTEDQKPTKKRRKQNPLWDVSVHLSNQVYYS